MRAFAGDRGHDGGGRCARADADDLLARQVKILGPCLRVDDLSAERVHTRPFGRVTFRVLVIALAHPEEFGGEGEDVAGIETLGLHRPALLRGGPAGRDDPVAIADMGAEIAVLDDLVHVPENLVAAGDGRADPGFVPVAEGVEIGVRPDARIAVHVPGASERIVSLEDHELLLRKRCLQMVSRADARDASANDEHIEMLGLRLGLR